MEVKKAFGLALRALRVSKGLTQEDFSLVSSRTFLSSVERGLKGATVEKMDEFAATMGVHPASVIVACYLEKDPSITLEDILARVRSDLS
ncbi:helix-turn-helix domain-containing protein [Pseudomonas sp. NPDC090208]|uniref:helix-turn-helix domain-containing protein n=1 Tax=Pseudomonas sp. NPDC090208 TaxID=3364478 RepID=UPI0037FBA6A4